MGKKWHFCCSPSPSLKQKQLTSSSPVENDVAIPITDRLNREDFPGGSIASGSSGFGSLPKKRPALFGKYHWCGGDTNIVRVDSFNVWSSSFFFLRISDRLNSESSNIGQNSDVIIECCNANENEDTLKKEDNDSACHSRNSSSASHLSKLSHSRQSSSGESASGHIRYVRRGERWVGYLP